MRAKTEYTQDKDSNGKTVVRKVGLAPVQRDAAKAKSGAVAKKEALWHDYLEVCDGDQTRAKNAIKRVVGELPSKDWTPEDLWQLDAELRELRAVREIPAVELTPEDEAMTAAAAEAMMSND